MEATFDYPYYKDRTNGFEIISLPYEHDGKLTFSQWYVIFSFSKYYTHEILNWP